MKISVITACYNNADTIRDTLVSVTEQDYPDIEYIIVDGDSKDDTLKIVDEFSSRIAKVVSGKDGGIYFALNKGLELATGEVIAFLHADDVYAGRSVLSNVMALFSKSGADSVYGDLQYVERTDTSKVVRHWKAGSYYDGIFRKGWMPPHPSFFLKRKCYGQFGVFNTTFRSAADYELMLRMLHKHKVSTAYLPEVLVKMRVGGTSNVTLKNRVRANKEDRRAWKINGLRPGLLTLTIKPLSKLKQLLGPAVVTLMILLFSQVPALLFSLYGYRKIITGYSSPAADNLPHIYFLLISLFSLGLAIAAFVKRTGKIRWLAIGLFILNSGMAFLFWMFCILTLIPVC
jgi:glycosyltransferase